MNELRPAIRILVTGAAGQIAYVLLPMLASGTVLGQDQPMILHLLDIPPMAEKMHGVVMELMDAAYPLVHDIVETTDVPTAFRDVDLALLVGARPRSKGMLRKDLLRFNCSIFKEQGQALDKYASRNVKVVVVGNPNNTNCLIAMRSATSLPPSNFTALTRLDMNRATAQLAQRLGVAPDLVDNVVIWGNHSSTQYPDVTHATVRRSRTDVAIPISIPIADDEWLRGPFIKTVQQRGAAIIAARGLSSALSAARAVCDHVRDWLLGTAPGKMVSMGVPSDGSYGIPPGLIYSLPVQCQPGGTYTIVQGLPISDFSRTKMDASMDELIAERDDALSFLA